MQRLYGGLNYFYLCLYLSIILSVPLLLLSLLLMMLPNPFFWFLFVMIGGGGVLFPLIVASHQLFFVFFTDKDIDQLTRRLWKLLKKNGWRDAKVGLMLVSLTTIFGVAYIYYVGTLLQFFFLVLLIVAFSWLSYAAGTLCYEEKPLKEIMRTSFFLIFFKPHFTLLLLLNEVVLFLCLRQINVLCLFFPGAGVVVFLSSLSYYLLRKKYFAKESKQGIIEE